MQTKLILAIVILFAVGVAGCGDRSPAPAAFVNSPYGQEGLRVTGTASVRAAPDRATLNIGTSVSSNSAKQSKTQCDQTMSRVLAALKSSGVLPEEIQTIQYSLNSTYLEKQRRTTWNASHTFEVRTKNVDGIADIIDAAVNAGADHIGSISYTVDSIHTLRAKAREQAIKVATEKAKQLADLMNVTLGRPVSIADLAFAMITDAGS